jgi:midasin (ATPase involved in ribosome maturation)
MARVSSFSPADRKKFIDLVKKQFGNCPTYTAKQILAVEAKNKLGRQWWIINDTSRRVSRGVYNLSDNTHTFSATKSGKNDKVKRVITQPVSLNTVPVSNAPIAEENTTTANLNRDVIVHNMSLIPNKASGYVKFGHFDDVAAILSSKKFYPIFITGLSGNGKTMMVEQACAKSKREMFRVNITIETDEDDLIGGFRLINGATVWHNGPVVAAMERGAVLLLDEVDLASNKIMCLQPILEGKPIYLKKINKLVTPTAGFTVVATANTKGRGSDDGKFIGTNILNEAFLERFSITMEQEYPPITTENKILTNVLTSNGIEDSNFVEMLTKWADIIRRTYAEGGISDIISTRRLVHICEAYGIFNKDKLKSIGLCLNRFDDDTKKAFMDLYAKVDEEVNPKPTTVIVDPTANVVATNIPVDPAMSQF